MDLVDTAIYFLGGYVIVIILAAAVMTIWGGKGEAAVYLEPEATNPPPPLQQQAGLTPRKSWGFRPPVRHSHYDPAPWQVQRPASDESSLENVDRATEIKRELGSEHPPWERLDRQGL